MPPNFYTKTMSVNKQAIRQARAYLAQTSRLFTEQFVEIPKEHWPKVDMPQGDTRIRVLRNRRFMVQVFELREGEIWRLSINRTEINAQGFWKDGITWEELMAVKRGAGYGDKDAVEVLPREADVVNVANMRHLFVLGKLLPFAWRTSRPRTVEVPPLPPKAEPDPNPPVKDDGKIIQLS